MRYSGSLVKKEREQIFQLFLHKQQLRFSDIERALGVRSNKIAYHLDKLVEEGLMEKQGDFYVLTDEAERFIPVFQNIIGKQLSPVPVVLVAIVRENKILLLQRTKRPYLGYWGLIGGKMLMEESFSDTTVRLVKERTMADASFSGLHAVVHERVQSGAMLKHGFVLFLASVSMEGIPKDTPHGKLEWFSLDDLPEEHIIPSDVWLIKNKLHASAIVESVIMEEDNGCIVSFDLS